jgi:hypothetical protein
MSNQELTPLSASRIKTAQNCSWTYFCKYVLKLPESTNEGASKGWICHLVFELLGDDKHSFHLKKALQEGSIYASNALERLVGIHANRLGINYTEALQDMDEMTLKGLKYDFFGDTDKKPKQAISEKDFDLVVEEGDKRYRIKGFIDKLFLYNKHAVIRDFKTSKQVFKGKDATDNLQDLMYSLAVKKMYPKYKERNSEFLFLRFPLGEDLMGVPEKGLMRMETIPSEELEGFEYHLTEINKYLNDFTPEKAVAGLAATKPYPSDGSFGGPLSCGREGFKKHRGEPLLDRNGDKIPAYICPFRRPMSYYVLVSESGKVKRGAFEGEEASLERMREAGDIIELREYEGCPHWNKKDEFDLS